MASFGGVGEKKAAHILHKGMMRYKEIIKTGSTNEHIRNYTNNINELIYRYVMPGDENILSWFHRFYATLLKTKNG